MQNSSKLSEKLRSWLFWSSTGSFVLLTRGSSLQRERYASALNTRRGKILALRPVIDNESIIKMYTDSVYKYISK